MKVLRDVALLILGHVTVCSPPGQPERCGASSPLFISASFEEVEVCTKFKGRRTLPFTKTSRFSTCGGLQFAAQCVAERSSHGVSSLG